MPPEQLRSTGNSKTITMQLQITLILQAEQQLLLITRVPLGYSNVKPEHDGVSTFFNLDSCAKT